MPRIIATIFLGFALLISYQSFCSDIAVSIATDTTVSRVDRYEQVLKNGYTLEARYFQAVLLYEAANKETHMEERMRYAMASASAQMMNGFAKYAPGYIGVSQYVEFFKKAQQ